MLDPDKRAERVDKILLQEYQSLWSYYIRTLDEKHKCLDYYFRMAVLPAGAVGALITATKLPAFDMNIGISFLGTVLLMIAVVGLVTYTVYVQEDANSVAYLDALEDIRECFRMNYPEINSSLGIERLRRRPPIRFPFILRSVGIWRGAMIPAVNSIIIAAALNITFLDGPRGATSLLYSLAFYLIALLGQVAWGTIFYRTYREKAVRTLTAINR